uniref:Immunoglobulin V-set domain-containing protein n=1 Tax=Pseudonaja textilis TaxID=8673 RepID=A0A670ZG77_PSETE
IYQKLLCCGLSCPTDAEDVVEQTRTAMIVTEGNLFLIQCSYEADWSVTNDPFWYIQLPGQPPKFFLSENEDNKQGFQVSHIPGENKRSGIFNLMKATSQLNDSAFYLCAFTSLCSA